MCILSSDKREKHIYHTKPDLTEPSPQKTMYAMKKQFSSITLKCVLIVSLTINPPKSTRCKILSDKSFKNTGYKTISLSFFGLKIFQLRIFIFNSLE